MKLGEFFIDLVVDSSSGELTVGNLVTKMGQLEAASVGAVGVLFELGAKLASFTDISIRSALGLERYATLTGNSTLELQKWQRVAEQAHVSGETVEKTFVGLSAALTEMRLTGGGGLLPLATRLGVDLSGKTEGQILEAIRKSRKFQSLSAAERTFVLGKVGIDPMMANVFKLTDAEFKKSEGMVEGMSEHGQEQFLNMATALSKISLMAKQLTIDVAEWDATAFLGTLEAITNTLIKMREMFKEFKKTPDSQVEIFDAFRHPLAPKSKTWWEDILRAMPTSLGSFIYNTSPELLREPAPRELMTPEKKIEPIKTQDIKIENHFNGMYTPEELTTAVIRGSESVRDKMLAENGRVLGGGLV